MQVVVADDDDLFRRLLERLLARWGYSAAVASDGPEACEMLLAAEHPPLAVIDWNMPGLDGISVCREVRKARPMSELYILMLTSRADKQDLALALDTGANDYVTKPFRLGVLLARLRAQLRQHEQSEDAVFVIGPYTFRPSAKILIHGETKQKVRLTEKETAILKYLYRSGNMVVGRDTLLGEVWGYNTGVTTHTLETHVYRLRQKIESDPSNAEILVTEPGGYRLVP